MKKHLPIGLASMLLAVTLQANTVTLTQARAVAIRHLQQTSPYGKAYIAASQPQLAYAAQSISGLDTDFYVFNYGYDAGFVIVSGDDHAVPVLAYSDHGTFDPQTLPCGLTWLLGKYKREMEYVRTHPEATTTNKKNAVGQSYTISPMLETHWHQSSPYNDYCPTFLSNDSNSLRCPAGCVALAMSQIMRYHKWPVQPRGNNHYSCNVNDAYQATNFYVDFNGYTIPWDNMLNDYEEGAGTTEQRTQIADFMGRIGRSINMSYGQSSGAYSYMVANALHQFFLYNPKMLYILKNESHDSQWQDMIISELKDGYPVYYEGRDYDHDDKQQLRSLSDGDSSVGHAFVIDGLRHIVSGYNKYNYFHINWGWGEGYDGYCLLSALTVSDYNWSHDEGAILNIRPAKTEEFAQTVGTAFCEPEVATVQSGSNATFHVSHASIRGNGSSNSTWGISIRNEDDTSIKSQSNQMTSPNYNTNYPKCYAMNWEGSVNIDLTCGQEVFGQQVTTQLPDGRYRSHLIWRQNGSQITNDCLLLMSEKDYIPILIRSGKAQFIEDSTTWSRVLKETFDQSTDSSVIKGDIANWKLTNCKAVNLDNDNKAIQLQFQPAKVSAIQTIDSIYQDIDQIELDVFNKGTLDVKLHFYYSTDGSSWNGFGSYHIIAPGEKLKIFENEPLTLGKPICLMIGMNAGNSCLIDNLRIHYTQKIASGDLTGDGVVDIDDLNVLINIMVHKAEATAAADVDGNGMVDIDDLNRVINIMVHKE